MKRLIVASICLLTSASVYAQVKIGFLGGLNFANQKRVTNTQAFDGTSPTILRFHVGMTSDIPVSQTLSVQPELYYSACGSELHLAYTSITNDYKDNIGYLKAPVLLTRLFDFNKVFWYVGAGPYVGRLVYSNSSFVQNDVRISAGGFKVGTSTEDEVTPYDYGFKIKTGFEVKRGVNIGAFYEHGLKDVNPQFVQTYNRIAGFSFSYLFSLTQEDKYNRYPDHYNY